MFHHQTYYQIEFLLVCLNQHIFFVVFKSFGDNKININILTNSYIMESVQQTINRFTHLNIKM